MDKVGFDLENETISGGAKLGRWFSTSVHVSNEGYVTICPGYTETLVTN